MANRPFIAVITVEVGASVAGVGSYRLSEGQSFEINRIRQQADGTCDITNIQMSNGDNLTNAGTSNPIPLKYFQDIASGYTADSKLDHPIMLEGGGQLTFYFLDKSGSSNTVQVFLEGLLKN